MSEQYRPRVVAFLDILGFSSLVEKADDPEWRSGIEAVVKTLRKTIAPNPDEDLHLTQFSDCIVISAPANLRGCSIVMQGAAMLANNLLNRITLLRGGIAVGNLIHSEDVLFGPGLLKAHEKDFAGAPPRISLDQSVLDLIAEAVDDLGVSAWIRYDDHDLSPMLHTLREYEEYRGERKPGFQVLDGNAVSIVRMIAWACYVNDCTPAVRAKWLWLERYWNETVRFNSLLPDTKGAKSDALRTHQ